MNAIQKALSKKVTPKTVKAVKEESMKDLIKLQQEAKKPVLVPLEEQLKEVVVDETPVNEEEILLLEGSIVKKTEELRALKMSLNKLLGKGKKKTGESKMDKAKVVFEKMNGKTRKEVIQAFIDEVELTKAGAATYYAILKNKKPA